MAPICFHMVTRGQFNNVPIDPFNFHYHKNKAHKREGRMCSLWFNRNSQAQKRSSLLAVSFCNLTSEIGLLFCTRYKNEMWKKKKIPPESMWLPELPVAFLALDWETFLHLVLHNHPWRIVCSSSVLFSSDRTQKPNGIWRVSPLCFFLESFMIMKII